jgi:hypothetical protein
MNTERMLKTESNNILMITLRSATVTKDDAHSFQELVEYTNRHIRHGY